jgi:predicted amidophosphoribosyltransferase
MANLVCVNHPLDSHVEGDSFCYKCGATLTGRERCECGRDLLYFYNCCPKCGKSINRKEKDD